MKTTVDDFFIKDNRADNTDSFDIQDIIEMAKGITRCSSFCAYLIDYSTKGFLWFCDNLSIFSGKSNEELCELGYEIFLRNVPEEELEMLEEINRKGWELFQKLPVEKRLEYTIFYSFHFVVGKRRVLVDHRLTPVKLDENGQCRIALCVFSPSALSSGGHVVCRNSDFTDILEYDFESKTWRASAIEPITDIERDVILLSFQGLKQSEIAERINYSVETVKHIKTGIFVRLGVKNIAQAVTYIVNRRLF